MRASRPRCRLSIHIEILYPFLPESTGRCRFAHDAGAKLHDLEALLPLRIVAIAHEDETVAVLREQLFRALLARKVAMCQMRCVRFPIRLAALEETAVASRAKATYMTLEDLGGAVKRLGTFSIEVTVGNLSDPARSRRLSLMVDAGATYTTLPREIVEDLGCRPIGSRQVVLADGREDEWPIATVRLTVGEQEGPTFCLIGPAGGPALLGAVTLEEFALGVDPVAKRLVPVRSYLG